MNILNKIIAHKQREVAERQEQFPLRDLEKSAHFGRLPVSFSAALKMNSGAGIIAEFKRRSPSKGLINGQAVIEEVTNGYAAAGATAISVLTDAEFFGGSLEDLKNARRVNTIPLLRKDFIISEYQITEAKSAGADVILLIAAALNPTEVEKLSAFARSLGLEVLLEIHTGQEIGHICEAISAVGVNNRNLADFSVDVQRSYELGALIPEGILKVSESAISNPETIIGLSKAGFDAFLIGENFMKSENPALACRQFIGQLQNLMPSQT
jgi:indole-3-glycerol phosphate synthase